MQICADVSACTDSAGSNPVLLGALHPNPEREHAPWGHGARQLEMLLPLTKSAVERIEEQRFRASHHNICLKVRGYMNVLFVQPSRVESQGKWIAELSSTSSDLTATYTFQKTCEIASSTWTDEFLDRLGLGKYLSVEIPMDLEEALKKTESSAERILAERIVNSAKLVVDAQKSMRKGDWKTAVGDIRLASECLEKGTISFQQKDVSVTNAIKTLFNINGFPLDVGNAVTMMIDNFHTFANAAHHIQVEGTEKQIEVKTPFDKEDAQFAIGTLVLLLNMLTKKLTKKTVG